MRVEAPEITDSARKRERLYRSVDAKAHILADLWKTANDMQLPLLTDQNAEIESEARRLRSVVTGMELLMPDAYRDYRISEAISSRIENTKDPAEQAQLRNNMEEIERESPNVGFVRFVDYGIEGLIKRRERVRSFQVGFGMPERDGYYSGDLERFGEVSELPKGLGPSITRVLVGKYSVNIFIDSEDYDKVEVFKVGFPTDGLHFGNDSLISVIRDPLYFYYRSKKSFNPDEVGEKLMALVRHEEFHAMEDAFHHNNPNFKVEKNQVERSISHVANGIPIKDDAGNTAEVTRVNGLDLTKIPDSSLEEFLAELASSSERSGIPASTYAIYTREKIQLISSVFTNPNINRTGVALKILRMFSNDQLKKELGKLYLLVDAQIPERRGEVDALFPIFPPSTKLRHVWSTVDRWIREKEEKSKVS